MINAVRIHLREIAIASNPDINFFLPFCLRLTISRFKRIGGKSRARAFLLMFDSYQHTNNAILRREPEQRSGCKGMKGFRNTLNRGLQPVYVLDEGKHPKNENHIQGLTLLFLLWFFLIALLDGFSTYSTCFDENLIFTIKVTIDIRRWNFLATAFLTRHQMKVFVSLIPCFDRFVNPHHVFPHSFPLLESK